MAKETGSPFPQEWGYPPNEPEMRDRWVKLWVTKHVARQDSVNRMASMAGREPLRPRQGPRRKLSGIAARCYIDRMIELGPREGRWV